MAGWSENLRNGRALSLLRPSILRIVTSVAAVIPLIVGLLVIVSWHLHHVFLMQIRPQYVAMVYNTALTFVVTSVCIWASWTHRRHISASGACFIVLLSSSTLLQDVLSIDLGIDQLLMTAYVQIATVRPGRMAPNTAVGFIFIGVCIFVLQFKPAQRKPLLTGTLATIPLVIGAVSLAGYLAGVPAAYAWGLNLTQMAVHTAVTMICCGIALLCLLLRERAEKDHTMPSWQPALVGIASATATLLLWQALVTHSRRALELVPELSQLVTMVLVAGLVSSGLLGLTCELIRRTRTRAAEAASLVQALGQQVRVQEATEATLREMNERHQIMIDTANDAFVSMEADGLVNMWNPQAESTFGWTRQEVIGKALVDLIIPEEYRDRHTKGIARYLKTGVSAVVQRRIEMTAMRRDGVRVPVELTIWPVRVNHVITFKAFIRDISERKRAEAALKDAKEAAEKANHAKSDFLAQMSHEIRTPMNAIVGMAELLKESNLDSQQHEYVDIFQRAGRTLLSLINDILDLSKIEAGHLDLEQLDFELDDVLSDVTQLLAPKANTKRIELTSWVDPKTPNALAGDPGRLKQLLVNLIGNAIKFTDTGEVGLTVKPDPIHIGRLHFTISDTGIGIPADNLSTIFEEFTQVDASTTRKYGGTGLGLAISHRLVSLMKGEISVESVLHEGSTFRFFAEFGVRPEPVGTNRAHVEDFAGLRVLVIDDNATNRLILQKTLLSWGLLAIEADGPAAGLEQLSAFAERGQPFSLVLLDRHMPGGDGLETAETILQLHPKIPVVLLTSGSTVRDAARCKELGLAGHLVKPIPRKNLLVGVCKAFGWTPGAAERVDAPLREVEPEAAPLRVLLAEDFDDNQFLIRAFLTGSNYSLDIAGNGAIALEKFTTQDYDIVLMDVQMPVMDGLTATAKIRAWERETGRRGKPILALTAHALVEDMQKSLDAGCSGHLTKPITKARLLEALQSSIPAVNERHPHPIGIEAPAGLEELVPGYLVNRRQDITRLWRALGDNDFEGIRILSHNMKGTGTSYGFAALTEIGGRIEESAKQENRERLASQIGELSSYLDRVELQPAAAGV